MSLGSNRLQGIDESLFMITAKPDGPPLLNEVPRQVHRRFDPWTAIDQIPEKDQRIPVWKNRQEIAQRMVTTMDISDHPVMCSTDVQR